MRLLSKSITAFSISFTSTIALAGQYAAVDSKHCHEMRDYNKPFILVLYKGDDLHASINHCASEAKLKSASVTALGQVHNPVLAYFSSDPKAAPTLTKFKGFFELASLSGNITNSDNKYYTHLYGVLADKKFQGIAGHINSSKVGLTVEITISPFSDVVARSVDKATGFGSIIVN